MHKKTHYEGKPYNRRDHLRVAAAHPRDGGAEDDEARQERRRAAGAQQGQPLLHTHETGTLLIVIVGGAFGYFATLAQD